MRFLEFKVLPFENHEFSKFGQNSLRVVLMQKWMPKSISGVNFRLDLCFQPFLRNSSKIHIFGLVRVSKDGWSETAKMGQKSIFSSKPVEHVSGSILAEKHDQSIQKCSKASLDPQR